MHKLPTQSTETRYKYSVNTHRKTKENEKQIKALVVCQSYLKQVRFIITTFTLLNTEWYFYITLFISGSFKKTRSWEDDYSKASLTSGL